MAEAFATFRLKVANGHWPEFREGRPLSKFVIFARDQFRCLYCDRYLEESRDCHIEHIVPVSDGGESTASNVAVSCTKCNLTKRAKRLPNESEYLATVAARNAARGIANDWQMNPMDCPPRINWCYIGLELPEDE